MQPITDRRSLLAFAAAVTATGVLGNSLASAQDATPDAVMTIEAGDAIPPEYAAQADTDWLTEGRDYSMSRSVPGSAISGETVGTLEEAWRFDISSIGPFGALVANPVISGDLLYLQDAMSNVYALNRESGELVWNNQYDLNVPSGGPNGVTVGYGAVFYGAGNGLVVAADKETGAVIWEHDITGVMGEGMCVSPLVYDNRVWVSNTPASTHEGGLAGRRGTIFCLDVTDGHVLWTFDTTTENLWNDPSVNSGGGFWHTPAVDSEGSVYFPIGNVYPWVSQSGGPTGVSMEDNTDYANNLLKLDTETGGLVWATNITGRDIFDLDNHLVATGTVEMPGGFTREFIFTSGKHGFMVAVDPIAGAEFWRTPLGTHNNAQLQSVPEGEDIEVWPGTLGGVETPFAFHEGVIYAPVLELPSMYNSEGLGSGLDASTATGKLSAVQGFNGNILWQAEMPSGVFAAATAVNDLVFTGCLDGVLRAFSTADGSLVWSAQTTAGLNAPLCISGDYVYVPAGGFLMPSEETSDPAPEYAPALIAYKLA